jgi:hypothetical protein
MGRCKMDAKGSRYRQTFYLPAALKEVLLEGNMTA